MAQARLPIPRASRTKNPRTERLLETIGPIEVSVIENRGRTYYAASYSNGRLTFDTLEEALQWARDNASAIQRFIEIDAREFASRKRLKNPSAPSKKFLKHLDEALAHHKFKAHRADIVAALEHPNAVAVRLYPDGWVENSYKYRANGTAVEVSEAGIFEKQIDRKRSNGRGPIWSVLSSKNGVLASSRG